MENKISWRRNNVIELSIQGYTQSEIASILKVGIGTVNTDLHSARHKFYRTTEELGELLYEENLRTLYGLKAPGQGGYGS